MCARVHTHTCAHAEQQINYNTLLHIILEWIWFTWFIYLCVTMLPSVCCRFVRKASETIKKHMAHLEAAGKCFCLVWHTYCTHYTRHLKYATEAIGTSKGSKRPLADHLRRSVSNYAIIAINVTPRYCTNCRNSTNTCPDWETDTWLVGISI